VRSHHPWSPIIILWQASSELHKAASEHAKWLLAVVEKHQAALSPEKPRLRLQIHESTLQSNLAAPVVLCVNAEHGGAPTLDVARQRLEALVVGSKPALLPSVGQTVGRGLAIGTSLWDLYACRTCRLPPLTDPLTDVRSRAHRRERRSCEHAPRAA
jgi:hypothetical protein